MRRFAIPKLIIQLLVLSFICSSAFADTTFVKFGSSWNYLDNGTAAPTGTGVADWRNYGFSDLVAPWTSGVAEMGYGDNDERTTVSFGPNAANKYITTYFRRALNIPSIASYGTIRINAYIDDGAIIYINGTRVASTNITAGTPTHTTLATSAAPDDGSRMTSFDIPSSSFVTGNNQIAVEVHQSSATSTDLTFDLELIAKESSVPSGIFAYGSIWKYLDNGTDQGTAWIAPGYNESAWLQGPGQLGYGDADEATTVGFGGNSAAKYITTYFRKTFTITSLASYVSFSAKVIRDDGIRVFVNGDLVPVFTENIPGTVNYLTPSTSNVEDAEFTFSIPANKFLEGSNTIAVEIHQSGGGSSDISFDMQLTGVPAVSEPEILRGPMLQMVSENAVSIRWKTDIASTTRIKWGTDPDNLTNTMNFAGANSVNHEMRITGLNPDTKYYYAIGTATTLQKGSYRNYFITSPPANTTRKIRIGVFGDPGKGTSLQKSTRDSYLTLKGGAQNSELAIMLGDNAYDNGTENEHQANFFDIYDENIFDNHVVFPVPGNHEYANSSGLGGLAGTHAIPYYDVFSLPTAAESGGLASGTEHYYSFDYGNIHFIMLDSYGYDGNKLLYDSTGAQALWLKADLAASAGSKKWTIVCLHHPPYTNGTHTSDGEGDLVAIRQQITPILERFGVDMVLAGHSHVYERSFLVKEQTGPSTPFNNGTPGSGVLLNGSSAKYDGSANSCPYFTIDSAYKHGTVYVVAGSAGQIGGGTNSKFPVFYYNNFSGTPGGEVGSLYLEIEDNRLDAKFIGGSGTVRDRFTIMKDVNKKRTVETVINTPTQLTASWVGSYNWFTTPFPPVTVQGTTKTFTVTPNTIGSYQYYVNDSISPTTTCIADTFELQVVTSLAVSVVRFDVLQKSGKGLVQWTTSQELNSDYFSIEKSMNGRDFELIMVIPAQGYSSSSTNYEFTDNELKEGTNYYRLIAADKDGSKKTVGIKSVPFKLNKPFSLGVTPNPVINGQVNMQLESSRRQTLSMKVYDAGGATVLSKSIDANSGSNQIGFRLNAGTYVITVYSQEGMKLSEKIIVK